MKKINYVHFSSIPSSLPSSLQVIKTCENLSKNIAELRRYIEQQKQIILYYESAITNQGEEDDQSDGKTGS